MDPFKTGLFATALVSLGKSGRFHLVWYQNRPQLQTGQFPLARRVHDGLVFIGYGMDRNCLKSFMATAKIKMTGSKKRKVKKEK